MEKLHLLVLRHRRLLVALFAGIAAWSAVAAIAQEPESTLVPVAARDLPSGSSIKPSDIKLVGLPETATPENLLPKRDIASRVVAGPMRAGEPFTDRRAISPQELDSGELLAIIDMPASSARLLRVGDLVDVLELTGDETGEARALAASAAVATLVIPADSQTATIGVAVKPGVARNIMKAQLNSPVIALPVGVP